MLAASLHDLGIICSLGTDKNSSIEKFDHAQQTKSFYL